MTEDTAAFEGHRPRLLALATRTLGSRADAEDVVQEAWLRLARHDGAPIEDLGRWLARVVGRLCLDQLRRRSARRETPLDIAPDPIVAEDGPAASAVAEEGIGLALLIVLEALGPRERLAFVLHDLFALPFAEIGPVLGGTADAAKTAASRARRRIREHPAPSGSPRHRRETVDAFLAASREGDFAALLAVLDPEVTWTRITRRGTVTTVGPDEILQAVRDGDPSRIRARRVAVDGEPGILVHGPDGSVLGLMICTVSGGRLAGVTSILDPARLGRMELPGATPRF